MFKRAVSKAFDRLAKSWPSLQVRFGHDPQGNSIVTLGGRAADVEIKYDERERLVTSVVSPSHPTDAMFGERITLDRYAGLHGEFDPFGAFYPVHSGHVLREGVDAIFDCIGRYADRLLMSDDSGLHRLLKVCREHEKTTLRLAEQFDVRLQQTFGEMLRSDYDERSLGIDKVNALDVTTWTSATLSRPPSVIKRWTRGDTAITFSLTTHWVPVQVLIIGGTKRRFMSKSIDRLMLADWRLSRDLFTLNRTNRDDTWVVSAPQVFALIDSYKKIIQKHWMSLSPSANRDLAALGRTIVDSEVGIKTFVAPFF